MRFGCEYLPLNERWAVKMVNSAEGGYQVIIMYVKFYMILRIKIRSDMKKKKKKKNYIIDKRKVEHAKCIDKMIPKKSV